MKRVRKVLPDTVHPSDGNFYSTNKFAENEHSHQQRIV